MRKIFISYRRVDAEFPAGALGRDLRRHFGDEQVFRDKEDVGGGVSWRQEVLHEINKDSVLLVLIGADWANAKDVHGKRRLDNRDDPLHLEIADGLTDRATILPILLENARMPSEEELPPELRPLAGINALNLRDGDWHYDLDKICKTLERIGFKPATSVPPEARQEENEESPNEVSPASKQGRPSLNEVLPSVWQVQKTEGHDQSKSGWTKKVTNHRHTQGQVFQKYWWVVAVLVPLGLALIVIIPSIVRKRESQQPMWVMPRPQPLPASVASLPAGEALNVIYTSNPPAPPPKALHPQIRMEIFAKRGATGSFVALKDGDALASKVNDYFIILQTLSPGYLYVFQVDSSGKKEWLFPKNESSFSSGSNPVQAGEVIQIPPPELERAFYLDETPGIEQIYAVLSVSRWQNLEQVLSRNMPQFAGKVQKPKALGLRGIGGMHSVEPLRVDRIEDGQTIPLSMTASLQEADGPFLVSERWFTHVDQN